MTSSPTEAGESSRSFPDWPLDMRAAWRLLVAYVVLAGVGLAAGFLLLRTPIGDPVERVDLEIVNWFVGVREPVLTTLSDVFDQFGATIPVVAGVVVAAVTFALAFRAWRASIAITIAVSLEAVVFLTVSTLIDRARPPIESLDPMPPTGSFPSGHTGAATALYLTLAIIVWWKADNRGVKSIAGVLAVLLPVSVALARVYRGMHFVTDVVFGMVLGAASAWVAIRIIDMAVTRNQGSRADPIDHTTEERTREGER